MRSAAVILVCLSATEAAAFSSAPYFPLIDGASWTYVAPDGVTTETRTVSGTTTFNGAQVKVLRDQTGSERYYTNDASGLRSHGALFTDPVYGDETDFSNPPFIFLSREATIGASVFSSGTTIAVLQSAALLFNYFSTATPVAIEPVIVAAGSFANAVHVRVVVSYSGTRDGRQVAFTNTWDVWLVPGVGSVRELFNESTSVRTTIWELQSYNVPDLIPDAFTLPSKTVQVAGVAVVSDPITVSGVAAPTPLSIVGGEYQVNGGAFRTDPVSVVNGDQVAVRVTSPQPGFSASATLDIGSVVATFTVVTAMDTTPAPFAFAPMIGAPLGVQLASDPITVSGLNTPAPISIVGGEYAVGGQAFTSVPGTVCNGCSVEVRVATAASYGTTTSATLTIGGVSAAFTVTTLVPSDGPFWELFYVSQPGDYIGAGRTRLIHFGPGHPDTLWNTPGTFDNGISVALRALDLAWWWTLSLDAPGTGAALRPGRYENATRWPFNGDRPGLDFSGSGRGCNILAGSFDILDLGFEADGQLQRLAVNFEQRCESSSATLVGELRFNSTVPLGSSIIRRTVADLNGDGRSDILWRNASTGENYLYPLQGTAVLTAEGYVRTLADLNWIVAGIGDFDGDGRGDILWRNTSTGQNYIYFMNGTAIKSNEGPIRTVADQNWQVAGIGDFDGDGKDDILWRNASTGENYVYLMSGLSLKPGEGYIRTVADLNWKVAGIGDFDGDGKADILWRNSSTGQNYVYPMDGPTIKASEGYLRTVDDTRWEVKGVGDFDGDGKADIVWRNSSSGQNYLYPMDGTTIKATEGYLRTLSDLAWQIAAVGDYDGDGKSDLLWRNSSTGQNYLYPMDGTTVKPNEGYLRTVPPGNWTLVPR